MYKAINVNSEIRVRYNRLKNMKDSVSKNVWDFVKNGMCRGTIRQFQPFVLWLNGMWKFLYGRCIYNQYGMIDFDRKLDIDIFTSSSQRAVKFFERTELFDYQASAIDACLNSIDNLVMNPNSLTLPEQWLDAVYPFLIGGVLQILEKIVKERTIELVPNFIAIQHAWTSMDDEISGKTNESN